MKRHGWLVVLVLLTRMSVVGHAQTSSRDSSARAGIGRAAIAGRVIDDRDRPLRRARVELLGSEAAKATALSFVTDADGEFAFTRLPAGTYTLAAAKPGYPILTDARRRSIIVDDGQQLSNLVLKLSRGGVITGTILDQNGEPAAGVQVHVLQLVSSLKGPMPAPAPSATPSMLTDDRGAYRAYGLAPGNYLVSAVPRAGASGVRLITQADLDRASKDLNSSANPEPAVAEPASGDEVLVGYAPVFYPGTAIPARATTVRVAPGEERDGVDFSLELARVSTIEGTVTSAIGALPAPVQVALIPRDPTLTGVGAAVTSAGAPDGVFSFKSVLAGQYTIAASLGNDIIVADSTRTVSYGGNPSSKNVRPMWALAEVTVDGHDQTGLALTLQPGETVSGELVVEVAGPTGPASVRLALNPVADEAQITFGLAGAQLSSSGRFVIEGVSPGRYQVTATATPRSSANGLETTIKSVAVNGRDVADRSIDVRRGNDVGGLVVTLTDRITEVSGTVRDASGHPTADYSVIVFPSDRALWTWRSLRIVVVRPSADGRFIFRDLAPGEYFLGAVRDLAWHESFDPKVLEEIVPASLRFTIAEGERRAQDLRLAGSGIQD